MTSRFEIFLELAFLREIIQGFGFCYLTDPTRFLVHDSTISRFRESPMEL